MGQIRGNHQRKKEKFSHYYPSIGVIFFYHTIKILTINIILVDTSIPNFLNKIFTPFKFSQR